MSPRLESRLNGGRLPLWLAVGHFILRAPARLARTPLQAFLERLALQPRSGAEFARVRRLSGGWLRLPGLRGADTCYLRSLVLFRFVDPRGGDLCLHFGVDEPRDGDRLRGHAWVSLDGQLLNAPPSLPQGRLREIYRYSILTGGSSASGAKFAAGMIRAGGPDLEPPPPSEAKPATGPAAAGRPG